MLSPWLFQHELLQRERERIISVTKIIEGEDIKRLAEEMVRYGERQKKMNFDRNAKGCLLSGAVLLIGMKDAKLWLA